MRRCADTNLLEGKLRDVWKGSPFQAVTFSDMISDRSHKILQAELRTIHLCQLQPCYIRIELASNSRGKHIFLQPCVQFPPGRCCINMLHIYSSCSLGHIYVWILGSGGHLDTLTPCPAVYNPASPFHHPEECLTCPRRAAVVS